MNIDIPFDGVLIPVEEELGEPLVTLELEQQDPAPDLQAEEDQAQVQVTLDDCRTQFLLAHLGDVPRLLAVLLASLLAGFAHWLSGGDREAAEEAALLRPAYEVMVETFQRYLAALLALYMALNLFFVFYLSDERSLFPVQSSFDAGGGGVEARFGHRWDVDAGPVGATIKFLLYPLFFAARTAWDEARPAMVRAAPGWSVWLLFLGGVGGLLLAGLLSWSTVLQLVRADTRASGAVFVGAEMLGVSALIDYVVSRRYPTWGDVVTHPVESASAMLNTVLFTSPAVMYLQIALYAVVMQLLWVPLGTAAVIGGLLTLGLAGIPLTSSLSTWTTWRELLRFQQSRVTRIAAGTMLAISLAGCVTTVQRVDHPAALALLLSVHGCVALASASALLLFST